MAAKTTNSLGPANSTGPTEGAEEPALSVFLTLSGLDESRLRPISAEFQRDERLSFSVIPFDSSEADVVMPSLTRDKSPEKLLLIALTNSAIKSDWVRTQLPRILLESGRMSVSLAILQLDKESSLRKLWSSAAAPPSVAVIDLSGDYSAGFRKLVEFIDSLVGGASVATLDPSARPKIPMFGVLQASSSEVELLSQLTEQIRSGAAINQKFLYWDAKAAGRWRRILNASLYETAQVATNLTKKYAPQMIRRILDDSGAREFTFINMGVGVGVKDFHILRRFCEAADRVAYIAVDDSPAMLELTIEELSQPVLAKYIESGVLQNLQFVLDDFYQMPTEVYATYLRNNAVGTRVFGLLGSSLGNFNELEVLAVIRSLMREGDYLLIGVEHIVESGSQDVLEANYSDPAVLKFEAGPITDLYGWEPKNKADITFRIESADLTNKYSVIPGSQTVVGSTGTLPEEIRPSREPLELFWSTKYDPKQFEKFLGEVRGIMRDGVVVRNSPVAELPFVLVGTPWVGLGRTTRYRKYLYRLGGTVKAATGLTPKGSGSSEGRPAGTIARTRHLLARGLERLAHRLYPDDPLHDSGRLTR